MNRTILLLLVMMLSTAAWALYKPSAPFEMDTSTLALWHFDENTGTTAYGEEPGDALRWPSNFDGTGEGWASGYFGSGLSFDGTTGSSGSKLSGSSGIENLSVHNVDSTVDFMLNLDAYPGTDQGWRSMIAIAGPYASHNSWAFEITSAGKLFYHFKDSAGTWQGINGLHAISQNVWHYIAATRTITLREDSLYDVTVKLYIDGDLDIEQTLVLDGVFQSWDNVLFGSQTSGLSNPLLGTIDEFRISNVIRTVPEPATISLLVLGSMLLLRRRKR
jgi:hypothetical protein